ncbi:MAG TPA: addiction module protein [Thermoguttaceae bacterium]|nr:addiction module protein [Thermoguttaceae bacterium]
MSLETIISNLSRDEKLAAMDLIWRDLVADADSFASPGWHEAVLKDRLENPAAGQTLPLEEAKAEIKEAVDARRASS